MCSGASETDESDRFQKEEINISINQPCRRWGWDCC